VKKKIAIKTLCFLLFARGKQNSRTHATKQKILAAMMAPLKRIAAASKHLHFYFLIFPH
jgi:hypothetical protein